MMMCILYVSLCVMRRDVLLLFEHLQGKFDLRWGLSLIGHPLGPALEGGLTHGLFPRLTTKLSKLDRLTPVHTLQITALLCLQVHIVLEHVEHVYIAILQRNGSIFLNSSHGRLLHLLFTINSSDSRV